jgi:hypothetical protein
VPSGHNTARINVMSMKNLHCWPVEYRGQVQPSLPVQACQCLPQHGCFICQLPSACQDVPWGLGGCRASLVLHLGCKGEAELLCLLRLPATVLAEPSTCEQTRFVTVAAETICCIGWSALQGFACPVVVLGRVAELMSARQCAGLFALLSTLGRTTLPRDDMQQRGLHRMHSILLLQCSKLAMENSWRHGKESILRGYSRLAYLCRDIDRWTSISKQQAVKDETDCTGKLT